MTSPHFFGWPGSPGPGHGLLPPGGRSAGRAPRGLRGWPGHGGRPGRADGLQNGGQATSEGGRRVAPRQPVAGGDADQFFFDI